MFLTNIVSGTENIHLTESFYIPRSLNPFSQSPSPPGFLHYAEVATLVPHLGSLCLQSQLFLMLQHHLANTSLQKDSFVLFPFFFHPENEGSSTKKKADQKPTA